MDKWAGKVAIVTGASVGIGTAIAQSLVKHGVKVAGLARRLDKLQELSKSLGKDKFCGIQCDVRNEENILKAFKLATKELGEPDILINNAGAAHQAKVIDMSTDEIKRVLETNLVAPAICAREFIQSVKKRDSPNMLRHIVNINSICGHFAEAITMPFGMYCPSKYGLKALGIELRHEIIQYKLCVKLTSISPGAVVTEMLQGLFTDEEVFDTMPKLHNQDIADAAIFTLSTPVGVEIHEITILPQNVAIGTFGLTEDKIPKN
ncbi:farnesol dehydrogenase-like [Calliopsis andreniformis]|uniref:farnesol dehydrogenase-like n=1 Tax=Calliopsis andreniformis TaxID=337506 RepID=UPI003FCEC0D0